MRCQHCAVNLAMKYQLCAVNSAMKYQLCGVSYRHYQKPSKIVFMTRVQCGKQSSPKWKSSRAEWMPSKLPLIMGSKTWDICFELSTSMSSESSVILRSA